MKKNFNLKLTAFLVSLFIGLVLVVLGSKFNVCLAIGLILLSLSLPIYVLYDKEKIESTLIEVSAQIEELSDVSLADNPDVVYALRELYTLESKLVKRKRKIATTFYLCAALLFIAGFASLI